MPTGYRQTGSIVGGARWTDATGENQLILSQRLSAIENDEVTLQEIVAQQYVRSGNQEKLVWQWSDRGMSMCDVGGGLVSELKIEDLDGDGLTESLFVTNAQGACDVTPVDFNLVLHSGSRALTIRGTNAIVQDGHQTGGDKHPDSLWKSAPAAFRTVAFELWDRTLEKYRIAP